MTMGLIRRLTVTQQTMKRAFLGVFLRDHKEIKRIVDKPESPTYREVEEMAMGGELPKLQSTYFYSPLAAGGVYLRNALSNI